MNIYSYILGELKANCYLLQNDKDCVLIDPADDASFVLEEIQRKNLTLQAMIATHGHFDHVMAVGEIQLSFPVPLYIAYEDKFLITRLGETARHFLGYEPYVVKPSIVEDISKFRWPISDVSCQIIKTPGHTPGGLSFYFPDEQAVFTGDTLFKDAIGRTDLSYSNKQELKDSLKKLFNLPEETSVYPGHGEETSILNEKRLGRDAL